MDMPVTLDVIRSVTLLIGKAVGVGRIYVSSVKKGLKLRLEIGLG
jgi:hypothetical protein